MTDGVDDAYGGSLLADGLLPVLTGEAPRPPARPRGGAAIRYLEPDPGMVGSISGLDRVLSNRAVRAAEVSGAEGEEVRPLRSSSDRCGFVRTAGPTPAVAWRVAEELAASIHIETRRPG